MEYHIWENENTIDLFGFFYKIALNGFSGQEIDAFCCV